MLRLSLHCRWQRCHQACYSMLCQLRRLKGQVGVRQRTSLRKESSSSIWLLPMMLCPSDLSTDVVRAICRWYPAPHASMYLHARATIGTPNSGIHRRTYMSAWSAAKSLSPFSTRLSR